MAFNTMNRMIEEERSEIGAFISLGIRKSTIAFSYLLYVFIACILGLVIGLSIGYTLIPRILYTVYAASFTIPELSTYANPLCLFNYCFNYNYLNEPSSIYYSYKRL